MKRKILIISILTLIALLIIMFIGWYYKKQDSLEESMKVKINKYTCYITEKNTKILDTYLIPDKDLDILVKQIIAERKNRNYEVSRTAGSYKREIKVHNRLYKLGLFKKKTKDTDLEEPIKKSISFIYNIFGN